MATQGQQTGGRAPGPQLGQQAQAVPRWLDVAAAWAWRLIVVATFIVLVTVVLYHLRVVTVPFFIALLLTTFLLPPVRFLERHGFRPALATATMFLCVLIFLSGLVYLLASPVSDQFRDLGPQVEKAVDDINVWLVTGPIGLDQAQLDRYVDTVTRQLEESSGSFGSGVVHSATLAAEVFTGIVLSVVLTFFFVKDGDWIIAAIARRFPEQHRGFLLAALGRAFHTLGGYLRGVGATGVVDATLIGLALWLIGVPLLVPLIVLTFFGAFIPVVGATVAGALAAAVALVNGGIGDAVLVIVAVLVVQQVEAHLLQPLLIGRAVELHPIVILCSLGFGAILAGLLGAFLAVPTAAVVASVYREVEERRAQEALQEPITDSV